MLHRESGPVIASVQVDSEEMRDYRFELDNPAMEVPLPRGGGRMQFRSVTRSIRLDLEPEEGSRLRFRSLKVPE